MKIRNIAVLTLLLAGVIASRAASPSFDEVYSILKTNLTDLSEVQLQKTAVEGLLEKLGGRALLLDSKALPQASQDSGPAVADTKVFDSGYGYLRLGNIGAGADKEVTRALADLSSRNKLSGLVIDLRFAHGSDLPAALEVADCFFPPGLLIAAISGKGSRSTGRQLQGTVPVAVLVNSETEDSAEVIAAALRGAKVGLLLGSTTAGRLSMYRDITLSTGQILRVASGVVKFDDGSTMPFNGVKPDIFVEVKLADEQKYLKDAYHTVAVAGKAGTPTQTSRQINEAELVRRHNEGRDPNADAAAMKKPVIKPKKVVRDPSLARAIDLLKGLNMVQAYRGKK